MSDAVTQNLNERELEFDRDVPNFELDKVSLQFDLDSSLRKVLVQRDIIYIILENSVFRIDLKQPSIVNKYSYSNQSIGFVDGWAHPSGRHLIVYASDGSFLYLHDSYRELIQIQKYKGLDAVDITFSTSENSGTTTGPFFIYTSDRSVYLSELNYTELEKGRKSKYILKLLTQTNSDIQGIYLCNNETRISIITRRDTISYDTFEMNSHELLKVFSSPASISKLPLKRDSTYLFKFNNESFIIIERSTLDFSTNDFELQLSKTRKFTDMFGPISEDRNSILFTDHHICILSEDKEKLIIYNKLKCDSPIVLDLNQYIDPNEHIRGITADFSSKTYWLYSSKGIYELVITDESISVWYNYYKLGRFQEALDCIKTDSTSNSYKKDMIIVKQGYSLLQQGGFGADLDELVPEESLELQAKGIKLLATSSEPFEKVCLMLFNVNRLSEDDKCNSLQEFTAGKLLLEYLLVKFAKAKTPERNNIKIAVLSSWIILLMLRMLYTLDRKNFNVENGFVNSNSSNTKRLKEIYLNKLNDQYEEFLVNNHKFFDRKTVYQLIKEVGYYSKLIPYAELVKDYDFIVDYYNNVSDWSNSLRTLQKVWNDPGEHTKDLLYTNSTLLLVNNPEETIDFWLSVKALDYTRLLPAIITYNKNNGTIPLNKNYSLIFLSKLIFEKNINDTMITNSYLSILVTYPITEYSSKKSCSSYISKALVRFRQFGQENIYDVNFILRLCLKNEYYKPAVMIFMYDLKLFEQALLLALEHNLTLLAEFVINEHEKYIAGHEDDFILSQGLNTKGGLLSEADNIKRIKLESETFSSRKKIWITYAKYIIESVFAGKQIEVLNNTRPELQEQNSNLPDVINDEGSGSNGRSLQEVSNLGDESKTSQKLHEALRYLIEFSQTGSNSSVLSLKDLLPLFPENMMLDDLKDRIVDSLNLYNVRISQLTREMEESLSIAENLKGQIYDSKTISQKSKVFTIVEPGEPCKLCNSLLISKNFIVFPNCHHNFHKDCLLKFYAKVKNDYKFNLVLSNYKNDPSEENKHKLENILLKECVLCNEDNINLIDSSLINLKLEAENLKAWEF